MDVTDTKLPLVHYNFGTQFFGRDYSDDDGLAHSETYLPGDISFVRTKPFENYKPVGVVTADFNGDGKVDFLDLTHHSDAENSKKFYLSSPGYPDILTKVTDGLGQVVQFKYETATRSTVDPSTGRHLYEAGSELLTGNIKHMRSAMPLVKEMSISSGRNGAPLNETRYFYRNGKFHTQGRGFLGFGQVIAHQLNSNIEVTTNYEQAIKTVSGKRQFDTNKLPLLGAPTYSQSKVVGGVNRLVETTTFNLGVKSDEAGSQPYQIIKNRIRKVYSGETSPVYTTTTTHSNYSWGKPGQVLVAVTDSRGNSAIQNTINNYLSGFHRRLGLPSSVQIYYAHAESINNLPEYSGPDVPAFSGFNNRTQLFSYNGSWQVAETTTQGVDGRWFKEQNYYGFAGNLTKKIVSGSDIPIREHNWTYDGYGKFATSYRNEMNLTEYYETDAGTGQRTLLTGPNGLATRWSYDNFGRKTEELRPDGTRTTWAYTGCTGLLCSELVNPFGGIVKEQTDGAPVKWIVVDALERPIRTATQAFSTGTAIFTDTQYNSLGQQVAVSRPYFEGQWGSRIFSTTDYDPYGRVITEREAGVSGTINHQYLNGGLTHIVSNQIGQTTRYYSDALERLILVEDHYGKETAYGYDPYGERRWIRDAKGNVSTFQFDSLGYPNTVTTPDSGMIQLAHNVLGQLVQRTDANGQVTSFSYDLSGRTVQRIDDLGGANQATNQWVYDSANKGRGKLHYATNPSATQTYNYDQFGRLASTNTQVDGKSMVVRRAYDSDGRLSTLTYPSGFSVQHTYDAYGYLSQVSNAANGNQYWNLTSMDAYGHATNEVLGNSTVATVRSYQPATGRLDSILSTQGSDVVQNAVYAYNAIGNLTSREDKILKVTGQNFVESFSYDNLNRLTNVNTVGHEAMALTYDNIGNITSKSDFGNSYLYEDSSQPNAVTSVKNGFLTVASYSYDANGNMLTDGDKDITYNSFNKPVLIEKGLNSSAFSYDADQARIKQISNSKTLYYLHAERSAGAHYEFEETSGFRGGTTDRHYIYGGTGLIGTIEIDEDGSETVRYFTRDNQGTVESVIGGNGDLEERYVYDAFGERKSISVSGMDPTSFGLTADQSRGYTGHEHLDDYDLIHMNARLYDPQLGRFISPDSIVQHPNSTQGWARYAYVGNNPMNFTDPTGHYSLSDLEEDFLGFAEKAMPYVVVIGFAFLSVGIGVLAMTPGLPLASKLFLAGMQFTAGMIASRGNVKSSLVGAFSVGFSALSGTSFGTFLGSLTDTGSVIGGILASGVIAAASGGSGTDGLIQGIISSFGAGLSNAMLAVEQIGVAAIAGAVVASSIVSGIAARAVGGDFRMGFAAGLGGAVANSMSAIRRWIGAQKDPHAGHDHSGPGGNPNPDGVTLEQMEAGHGTWWHNTKDRFHRIDENGVYDPNIKNQKWQDAYGHEEIFDVNENPVRDHNGPTFNRFPGNLNPLHLYDIIYWERNGTGWPDDHSTRESRCVIFC